MKLLSSFLDPLKVNFLAFSFPFASNPPPRRSKLRRSSIAVRLFYGAGEQKKVCCVVCRRRRRRRKTIERSLQTVFFFSLSSYSEVFCRLESGQQRRRRFFMWEEDITNSCFGLLLLLLLLFHKHLTREYELIKVFGIFAPPTPPFVHDDEDVFTLLPVIPRKKRRKTSK